MILTGTGMFASDRYPLLVAAGNGTNVLAYSLDGVNWTGSANGNSLMSGANNTAAPNGPNNCNNS